jgi:lipid-A-disaccharide synthase
MAAAPDDAGRHGVRSSGRRIGRPVGLRATVRSCTIPTCGQIASRLRSEAATKPARVFISVAEDSADVHAAALLRKAREALPPCHFYGLTGPRLRQAGAETLTDLTAHAAMLTGVFSVVRRAWRAIKLVERAWDTAPPDLVVLLDSPELHLRLARRAHRRGLPVLYYIAPQTWAAREGRNRQIATTVDRLACILPFEEEYFRRASVNAEYVGHPLFETLRDEAPDARLVAHLRSGDGPLVAVLPGSRRHVIDTILPLQLQVLRRLRTDGRAVRAAISGVSPDRIGQIRSHMDACGVPAEIVVADNASLLTAADLVLVASGTATLHVAHYRKPMVVLYDAGRLLSFVYRPLGRFVLKTPHLSLVNVLAGRRVVPEFMPFVRDAGEVARVAARLLADEIWRRLMVEQLDEVVRPLETTCASANVCRIMKELLNRR